MPGFAPGSSAKQIRDVAASVYDATRQRRSPVLAARRRLTIVRLLLVSAAAVLAVALVLGPAGPAVAGRATAVKTGDSPQQMRAIVRAWSARLNAEDNNGLARLFAVPALVIQAPYAFTLRTRAEIAKWYAGLPCSGRVVSIMVRGKFATAVFRLGARGASPCDAPGTLAAARFEIEHGKIRVWEQVAVPTQKPKPPSAIAA